MVIESGEGRVGLQRGNMSNLHPTSIYCERAMATDQPRGSDKDPPSIHHSPKHRDGYVSAERPSHKPTPS